MRDWRHRAVARTCWHRWARGRRASGLSRDGGTDAAYETAQDALAKLARKPSASAVLGGLLAYADEVRNELAKLTEASADAATAAASKGDAARATTTAPAADVLVQ